MHVGKKRILIAEPDPDMLFIVGTALQKAGYAVEANDAGVCILDQKTSWPDLFILDKDLPTIDGLAVCKYLRIKQDTREIPIIVLSSYAIKNKAHKAGATAFIRKPFQMQELLRSVEKYMSGGSQRV